MRRSGHRFIATSSNALLDKPSDIRRLSHRSPSRLSNTPSAQKPETAPPRSSVVRLSLSSPLLRPVEACLYPARELNVWPVHRLAAGRRVAHVEVQPIACAPPIPVSSRRLAPRAA